MIFVMAALFMGGCGEQEGQEGDKITLVLAAFGESPELERQVTLFNQSNEEYQIQIESYQRSELSEEDGRARLQREIMSGKGPDMIDFGAGYATSDIVGGYTENLLPYLGASDEEIKEKYFYNILEAFFYKDALYALPIGFTLQTFAGSRSELGSREHWNIREMIDCYGQKSQDMLLYPGQTKADVFGTILTGSMDYYIDWESGTCSFDGEEFQNLLSFADTFPEKLRITEDFSVKQTFFEGGALLLPLQIRSIFDICKPEFIFGEEEIAYIGFPVEENCGTVIKAAGPVLAISISSRHKEVSWEFISRFLEEQYQREDALPLCRSALEVQLFKAREREYMVDSEGNQVPVAKDKISFEGEKPVEIYCITAEQADRLINLIEEAVISTANDYELYSILLEESQGYFFGERTLEEVCKIMQSRASIYLSEKVTKK